MVASVAAVVAGLFGTVVLSPATPVCQAGKPCTAPAAGVRLTFSRGATAVRSVVTTSTGRYRVVLAPGVYSVRVGRSKMARLAPTSVTVARGTFRRRDFTLDTGIR
jgi:Carboxypeptidase regulatory-like domain